MSSFGDRLREERDALGLSQTQLAELASTTRKSQFNYETDARRPDSDYLVAVAAAGVDVMYVLTGQRDRPALSAEEQMLLSYFRRATADRRDAAIGALLGASQAMTMNNSAPGSVQVGYVQGRARVITKRK